MSYPVYSKLVEVWNPDQKSFYTACLMDIDDSDGLPLLPLIPSALVFMQSPPPLNPLLSGMGVIQFMGSQETQKTPLSTLRPCMPSETDPSLQYSNNEQVEASGGRSRNPRNNLIYLSLSGEVRAGRSGPFVVVWQNQGLTRCQRSAQLLGHL